MAVDAKKLELILKEQNAVSDLLNTKRDEDRKLRGEISSLEEELYAIGDAISQYLRNASASLRNSAKAE